jgi:hypothetical protein
MCSIEAWGQSGPVPLVEYRFNGSGPMAENTGLDSTPLVLKNAAGTPADLHSLNGGGVSGQPGDRAFDNSASTGMGNAGEGGIAEAASLPAIHGLLSATLQGWFKSESGPLNSLARLFDTYASSERDQLTIIGRDNGKLQFLINHAGVVTSNAAYAEVGQWVFFAITYDGTRTSQNVQFYKGTAIDPVTLVETRTINQGRSTNHTGLWVGNICPATNDCGTRPTDGLMDNFRIFGSTTSSNGVLTLEQLESLRTKDLLNDTDKISLTIRQSNGVVTIAWPAYPGGFTLETTARLNFPIIWEPASATVIQTNGSNVVVVPATGTQFYRLKR